MPLNSEAQALLDIFEHLELPPFESLEPEAAREMFDALRRPAVEPCHEIRDVDAGGVRARLYRPGDETTGLLVWFHGGGWVLGDLDMSEDVCRRMASGSGHSVLSIDYALAPEHAFPGPLTDCVTATRWAHANADALGIDPDRIAVGGDSAGANLAAVVAQLRPVPLALQALVYPVTDARMGTASYVENAEGYFLTAAAMGWFIDLYLSGGNGSANDPRVSPLLASPDALRNSPSALVITAGFDPLRDEGAEYVERLDEAGVAVSHVHYPGQIHGFYGQLALMADARSANAVVAQALSEALSPADM